MRIITKDITHELDKTANSSYLKNKNYMIFDIETTGFSREYEIIYMLGCICKTEENYIYHNIFAETPDQEPQAIEYFFKLLENMDYIIHFNGNRFDIPFLLTRAAKYNIRDLISPIESIDIYDLLRPFRKSLDFPNLKLDTIQAELGYKRLDECSGGDLIQIYHNYANKPYEPYYDLLERHNKEDVEGMINLLPIIDVIAAIDEIIEGQDIKFLATSINKSYILFSYELPIKVFMDFKLSSTCHSYLLFEKDSNKVTLHLPISKDTKLFFFENHADYLYIIEKDEVMHKSIASFIPSSQKRRAKKAECYVKHTGLFIPFFCDLTEAGDLRLFKDSLRAKKQFVLATSEFHKSFYTKQIQGFLKTVKGIK